MESPEYLIIVTLYDGQNFALPDGAPDRVEASVFAEARFGNESYLKSDPIKLVNANPEFNCELAWQLDKKSLHQLRVERRSIKLQIFMQTKEKRKSGNRQAATNGHLNSQLVPETSKSSTIATTNGTTTTNYESNSEAHKVELVGYTIIDIRSAQETKHPKSHWMALLNPKFKKHSDSRPEIQLALNLDRVENSQLDGSLPSTSLLPHDQQSDTLDSFNEDINGKMESMESNTSDNHQNHLVDESMLHYKTCLDFTLNPDSVKSDEIIDNDIKIRSKDGIFYIYDAKDEQHPSMDDCCERYKVTVTIPFNSDLDVVVKDPNKEGGYYFSVSLFGSTKRTQDFHELTCLDIKEVEFLVCTTHIGVLAIYFEINSNLTIKLHHYSGESIGVATIQVDRLCSVDTKRRSIEGIFSLQSMLDHDTLSPVHPSIGVSVLLEPVDENEDINQQANNLDETQELFNEEEPTLKPEKELVSDRHIEMAKEHFGADINDLFNSFNDTHQLTFESNYIREANYIDGLNDCEDDKDDHHFCFTIDLKKFSYSSSQTLIPTLRELVVRYSYPFFGYQDTITTDASIPINANNSIIVSGFCEFNFATTYTPLLTALKKIPLNLDILICDETQLKELTGVLDPDDPKLVATCSINLSDMMCLNETSVCQLKEKPVSTTASVPIYSLDGGEIGTLQMYLCLRDLGRPSYDFKSSVDNVNDEVAATNNTKQQQPPEDLERTFVIDQQQHQQLQPVPTNSQRLEAFIGEAKSSFELWKEEFEKRIYEDVRKRENERFKRLYQRLEAKDVGRELEFKKKMEDLCSLESRFRKSLACVEILEKTLNNHFEQIKTKDSLIDSRFESVELKISQAINNIKLEYDKKINSIPVNFRQQRSLDESQLGANKANAVSRILAPVTSRTAPDMNGCARRQSVRNIAQGNIPLPVRSSSLVRNSHGASSSTTEGNMTTTRFVKRPVGMVTTVVNGVTKTRPSTSTRVTLSKETQEKLASLRREKAELLKRGCKPNDELIQEINSLIEKLVC